MDDKPVPGGSRDQVPGSKTGLRRPVVWMVASALFGVLAVLVVQKTFYGVNPVGSTPTKFIPAQTLRFVDRTGTILAELIIGTDGVNLLALFDGEGGLLANLVAHSDGQCSLMLLGGSSSRPAQIFVLMTPYPVFTLNTPEGKHEIVYSKDWKKMPSGFAPGVFALAKEIAKAGYSMLFPEEPKYTVDEVTPTQDLRLIDKAGQTIGVLGLSQGGDPCLVLTDARSRILASWCFAGRASQWKWLSEVSLFDNTSGSLRISVQTRPGRSPTLWIFESGDIGPNVLDLSSFKEIPLSDAPKEPEPGTIPWLKAAMFEVKLPIVLLDQRDKVVWRAP